jgi:hypothetical protein
MEWLTKNFAVVSAVLVFAAATGAVFFMFGYLSTFDWTLIWLVEYTDLAQLFLIVGGLISGFGLIFMFFTLVQNYYLPIKINTSQRIIGFGIVGVIFLIGLM